MVYPHDRGGQRGALEDWCVSSRHSSLSSSVLIKSSSLRPIQFLMLSGFHYFLCDFVCPVFLLPLLCPEWCSSTLSYAVWHGETKPFSSFLRWRAVLSCLPVWCPNILICFTFLPWLSWWYSKQASEAFHFKTFNALLTLWWVSSFHNHRQEGDGEDKGLWASASPNLF